jgi:hypothetical protein
MQSVQAVAIIIGKGGRGIQHGHSIRGLKLSMVPIDLFSEYPYDESDPPVNRLAKPARSRTPYKVTFL